MKQIMPHRRIIVSSLLAAVCLAVIFVAVSAAVTLTSFKATPEGNDIVIRWQTGSELDAQGFLVMKSIDDGISYDPLGDFVPCSSCDAAGATYVVTDTDVERGSTYDYQLYSYDTSLNFVSAGPISATLPLTSTSNTPTPTRTPTSTPTRTPTATPTWTPTSTPTATSAASNQPTETNAPTVTRPPTNTPTPLSLGASTITPSAPQTSSSAATATPRPTVISVLASTVSSLATPVAPSGHGAQSAPTIVVSTPLAQPRAPVETPGIVEASATAQTLVAMEPMVIATSAAPAANAPTSDSDPGTLLSGLMVLAVLLLGSGLFFILRQSGR